MDGLTAALSCHRAGEYSQDVHLYIANVKVYLWEGRRSAQLCVSPAVCQRQREKSARVLDASPERPDTHFWPGYQDRLLSRVFRALSDQRRAGRLSTLRCWGPHSTRPQAATERSPSDGRLQFSHDSNTTYHGDHTFGNAAFPPEVMILSSHLNKLSMSDLAREKKRRSGNLRGNLAALDEVTGWRKPDVTFTSDRLEIDLGPITVELWYFGPGNAPGDTTVYVPSASVAWIGNYLMARGVPPMLLEGGTTPYITSLERFRETLDVETIVPGHGPMGKAQPAVENFIAYMREIQERTRQAIDAGLDLDATVDAIPMSSRLHPPADVEPDPNMAAMAPHLHRLNVMAVYRALTSHQAEGETR